MNFETLDSNCQDCKTSEQRPLGLYLSYQARLDPSMEEFFPDEKRSERLLQGCNLSIENYQNIIAVGPDSIVFVNDIENPKNVTKLYFKASFERLLQYKEETREFNKEFSDKHIRLFNKEFVVQANPIIEVKSLCKDHCIATLSEYIPGENEYERFIREYETIRTDGRQTEVLCYERELHKAIDRYIDPRNFKVNEEEREVIITDLVSSFKIND